MSDAEDQDILDSLEREASDFAKASLLSRRRVQQIFSY